VFKGLKKLYTGRQSYI